jgi:hypothetical protein
MEIELALGIARERRDALSSALGVARERGEIRRRREGIAGRIQQCVTTEIDCGISISGVSVLVPEPLTVAT